MKSEDMYVRFKSAMQIVTVFIATYSDTLTGDVQAAAEKVTVTFGSSLRMEFQFAALCGDLRVEVGRG